MTTIRIRVTGSTDDTEALITAVHALDCVEHVEEVDDLMAHMDDEDSSSAGLTDDIGPGVHEIEIEAPDPLSARQVFEIAERASEALGVPIEFLDEF
ncbi:MAG TPA: hypothetical protein VF217_08980 [Rhodanobacteraceae bacterium]